MTERYDEPMLFFSNFWDGVGIFFATFVVLAYLIAVWAVVVDVFSDRTLNGWAKALWVLFLVFVPFLTVLVYLIARGGAMAKRRSGEAEQDFESSDAYFGGGGASPAAQIAQAKQMLDEGKITQAQYDDLKAKGLA